ncbi:MAG: aminotransferase class I/II-fold pyridoxal phosphate-dependent enzyme [Candidatus Kapabacteria bacterium]|nr:aminotransferase class I/II-fold pyridoxal phosphate-dependent enzyme [Candidatus Kapabacteria bacterium]
MIDVPAHLKQLMPYTPGASPEQIRRQYGLENVLKLASNENPFGPSPKGIEAAANALQHAHRYNDGGAALRDRLAEHHGVSPDAISVNNGSDAIIHQIMRTFLLPGQTALSAHGSFVSFRIAVLAAGATPTLVPMGPGYRFDVEALAHAYTPAIKVIYIANPNNPTGTFITRDELQWLIGRIPDTTLIVLDEAYYEYAKHAAPESYPDAITLDRPNVISLRTFSKAYGLASLRVGYAVGHPDVMQWLRRTSLPFDPNGPACAAAVAALDDVDFVATTVATNHEGLSMLQQSLRAGGFATTDSVANFVMVDCVTPERAADFHVDLLRRGYISRPLAGFGIPNGVRISTGLPEQNSALANVLRDMATTYVSL